MSEIYRMGVFFLSHRVLIIGDPGSYFLLYQQGVAGMTVARLWEQRPTCESSMHFSPLSQSHISLWKFLLLLAPFSQIYTICGLRYKSYISLKFKKSQTPQNLLVKKIPNVWVPRMFSNKCGKWFGYFSDSFFLPLNLVLEQN